MKVKYPRTPHLPFSQGVTSDDKIIQTLNHFVGEEIVITEKMDGENTTMGHNYIHARSIDSAHHESRNWVKKFHGTIGYNIPENMRVCGENMYAEHSIQYDDLRSYFYGFSVWEVTENKHVALDWDMTMMWFTELGITPVPVLYRGPFNLPIIHKIINALDTEKQEGIVMRVTREINFSDFDKLVAKWVRKGHVQDEEHWMHKEVKPNKLGENND